MTLHTDPTDSAQRILDTAMAMAEKQGWEALRLYQVADQLQISLDQVRCHFDQKEALIDAWFDRADQAMLTQAESTQLQALPEQERLEQLMMGWFQALAPHQDVSRQMVEGKFEPGHLHTQVDAILRVSRTVQWLREAAHRDAFLVHRAIEETLLTSVFVVSFGQWLVDRSHNFEATRHGIQRRLKRLHPLLQLTQSAAIPQPLPRWLRRQCSQQNALTPTASPTTEPSPVPTTAPAQHSAPQPGSAPV
ncbi:MAG: TetR/AcrR family transcriptional regulator [Motiliproteus sp.]